MNLYNFSWHRTIDLLLVTPRADIFTWFFTRLCVNASEGLKLSGKTVSQKTEKSATASGWGATRIVGCCGDFLEEGLGKITEGGKCMGTSGFSVLSRNFLSSWEEPNVG
jgi:hypothetical protein